MSIDGFLGDWDDRHGQEPFPLDDEPDDEEESEEDDTSGLASNYGSLTGLAGGIRKKRPVLMLDPEEAEDALRLVQEAAAQQLAGEGPTEAATLVDFSGFSEPQALEEEEEEEEAFDLGEAAVDGEPAEPESKLDIAEEDTKEAVRTEPVLTVEALPREKNETLPVFEEPWEAPSPLPLALSLAEELPTPLQNDLPYSENGPDLAAVRPEILPPSSDSIVTAPLPEPQLTSPLPVEPVPTPLNFVRQGHSLRHRIHAPQSSTPLADRLDLLLRQLWRWVKSLIG